MSERKFPVAPVGVEYQMRQGLRYIVTTESQDREFQVGDHVWLEAGGSIMCVEAAGWMAAEDVPAATRGMTVELDREWADKRRAELQSIVDATSEAAP